MQIGLISDTHGLMRPEALDTLRGCAQIIHAGDVGRPEVLAELSALAPTRAVKGNVDTQGWATALPTAIDVEIAGLRLHIVHDIADLAVDPAADRIAAVIYGHSHKPSVAWRDGVLFCNPGAAGPRRFKLPVTVAILEIGAGLITPRIVDLGC